MYSPADVFRRLFNWGRPQPIVKRANWPQLAAEQLEDRITPAPVLTNVAVLLEPGQTPQVVVRGSVMNANLPAVTVDYNGAASGLTTVDGNGHFKVRTPVNELSVVNLLASTMLGVWRMSITPIARKPQAADCIKLQALAGNEKNAES